MGRNWHAQIGVLFFFCGGGWHPHARWHYHLSCVFRTLLPIPPLNRKGTLLFRAGYSWRLCTTSSGQHHLQRRLDWNQCCGGKCMLGVYHALAKKCVYFVLSLIIARITNQTCKHLSGCCVNKVKQRNGRTGSSMVLVLSVLHRCMVHSIQIATMRINFQKPQIETITTITKSTNGYGSKWLNSYWLPFFNQVDPGHKIPTKMTQSPRLVHHFILPISLTTASISSKMPHKPRDKLRFCGDFQCTQRGRCLYTYIYIYQLCACMHAGMHPWMYGCMDVWMYGYLCICMDICGSIYIYIDYICGYVWICMDVYGHVWMCMEGVRNCFGNYCFSVLGFFVGSAVPSIFLAICISLELEAGISWSSNLSFSMIFATYFGAQTFHVGWYFATRGHLGFV